GVTGQPTPLLLAVLDLSRHEHGSGVLREVRGLVVLGRGAALDLFLFSQQALKLGIDLHDGPSFAGLVLGRRRRRRLGSHAGGTRVALIGAAASATRGDDPAGPALTAGLADRHGRLARDLVLGRDLVGEDVALVDPD